MTARATIFDYFAEQVAVRGDAVAYLHDGGTTTFGEIDRRAARCRGALRDLGVQAGDRIALAMSDGPDLIVALLAVMGLGAIAVPCSMNATGHELAYMVDHTGPRCAIVSTDQWANAAGAAALLASPPLLLTMGPHAVDPRRDLSALADQAAALASVTLDPDATAVILYTSGTTGHPKGAVHRQRDIPYVIEATGRGVYGIGPGDRVFATPRIFFSYGFSSSFSVPLGLGAACILTGARPTPQLIADAFKRHRPTVFLSVPAVFRALLDLHRAGETLETAGLRFSASGGEKLTPEVFAAWQAVTGTEVLDVIGTTEVMYGFISNRPGRVRPGSTGEPIRGYDVKLVDDAGNLVERAGRGNLFVRGGSISTRYWNRSQPVLDDGWLRTGDVFSRDHDGFYFFEGRSDDLFKSSGLWVSPAEVEDVLCGHPAVLEAAVVAVPAADGGFASVASIVLRPGWSADAATVTALAAHAAGLLPRYKRPQSFRFVSAIPRTATGKIQRFRLRESAVAATSTKAA